jgi:alpha-beta hydrolase superfamily lysophospholipase
VKTLSSIWHDERGVSFHLHGWEPDGRCRAVIALVHGLGEHIGRYAPIGEAFAEAGFALIGFDLRGHGRSGGPRGHTPTFEALMDDIGVLLETATARYRGLPVFLYGHSLGGNLVLNYALRRLPNIHGVIATSPWLRAAFEPPPWKVLLARILDPVAPSFSHRWGLDSSALSQDSPTVGAFDRDPLSHGVISVRTFLVCDEAGSWALQHASEFPLPLLLMHGTADRITSWEASREFAVRLGGKVTWRSWEGFYHELHNETERAAVLKSIIKWVRSRMTRRPPAPTGQKRPGMREFRPTN